MVVNVSQKNICVILFLNTVITKYIYFLIKKKTFPLVLKLVVGMKSGISQKTLHQQFIVNTKIFLFPFMFIIFLIKSRHTVQHFTSHVLNLLFLDGMITLRQRLQIRNKNKQYWSYAYAAEEPINQHLTNITRTVSDLLSQISMD